jgi:Macrocin-O-methyltransferase (TylF)
MNEAIRAGHSAEFKTRASANIEAMLDREDTTCRDLYLDLLKKCLVNSIYEDCPAPIFMDGKSTNQYSSQRRSAGRDWPTKAHTMIGLYRLNNLRSVAKKVLEEGIEGDFLEAGVWRGGATIFMRGLLKAYAVRDRLVWVADSFCGFPPPAEISPRSYTSAELRTAINRIDAGDPDWKTALETLQAGTTEEDVKTNFERYGLLDDQVRFLPGFFSDTLPSVPVKKLAILRADGDLYDSTYQILESLYPRVSPRGYVIIDDYYTFSECRQAVHDYLSAVRRNVTLVDIDADAVFWKKEDDHCSSISHPGR